MFENKLDQDIFKYETFTEYKAEFEKLTITKNRKTKTNYKTLTKDEKEEKEAVELLKYIKNIESDKLYYFCLANETTKEVLIIKAPSDGKENKNFLGYEWSGRKGNEGIQYSGETLNHINTPLYNPNKKQDKTKINHLISNNFNDDNINIPQELEKFVSKAKLVDMLNFSRKDFNKAIGLVPKKEIKLLSKKYQNIDLDTLLQKIKGNTTKITKEEIHKVGKFPVITQEQNNLIAGYSDLKSTISDLPLVMFGDHSCTFKYIDFPFIRGADGTQLLKFNEDKILTKYFYYLSAILEITNDDKYERHMKYLKSNKIPLPPLNIQKDIIQECSLIDDDVEKANKDIDDLNIRINSEINNIKGEMIKLGDLHKTSSGGTPLSSNQKFYVNGDIFWVNSGEVKYGLILNTNKKINQLGLDNSSAKLFPINTVLIAMYGATVGQVGILGIEASTNQALCGLLPNTERVLPLYSYYFLRSKKEQFINLSVGTARTNISQEIIKNFKIPLPSIEIQKEIVSKIQKLEIQINESRKILDSASDKKKDILKKYL
jgi:restriction endonuclease S subunit